MNKFLHKDKDNVLYPTLIIALFAIIFLSLTSCGTSYEEMKQEQAKKGIQTIGQKYSEDEVHEYPYKGHTYIVVGYGKDKWGSHAGHCENPVHKCN